MDLAETVMELWGIWQRSIDSTYVSRDLPRLLNNIAVRENHQDKKKASFMSTTTNLGSSNQNFDENQDYEEKYPNGTTPTEIGLINAIISLVNSCHDVSQNELEDMMSDKDVAESFINSKAHKQAQKLVKFFDQAYSISFLSSLALHLMKVAKLRFLDSRGDWWIFINKNPNTFSFLARRTEFLVEQPDFVTLNRICKFTWDLEIEFDSFEMKHFKKVSARLLKIENLPNTNSSHNEKIQILVDSFQNLHMDNITQDFLASSPNKKSDKITLAQDSVSKEKKTEYSCNI